MDESRDDLERRITQLESRVAWLLEREAARGGGSPTSAPSPAVAEVPPVLDSVPSPSLPPPPPPWTQAPPIPRRAPPPPPPSSRPRETNPTVLLAAAGAAIFLLGVIFFLWLSFQRGWVSPQLRILLGLAAGTAISAYAGRLIVGEGRRIGVWVLLAGLGTLQFTFWAGSAHFHFFDERLGFAGVAVATLFGGGLAARAGSGGALTVALVSGFIAPPVFSTGSHDHVALGLYLALLVGAAIAVPYLAKTGARWHGARWTVLAFTWAYLWMSRADARAEVFGACFGLMLLHYFLALVWVWLPGQAEPKPSSPTLMWFLVSLNATGLAWSWWGRLKWPPEWFSGVALGFALVNLLMVKPMRTRFGSRQADLGLLVLAAGHLALAVPIALDWRWVGPLWGAFALGLAWASGKAGTLPDWDEEEARNLRRLALGMALLASVRWLYMTGRAWDRLSAYRYETGPVGPTPFLNGLFALGVLVALAWGLQARRRDALGAIGFFGLQVVGVMTLAMEIAYALRTAGADPRASAIAFTVVWAVAGALQWLRSLGTEEHALRRGLGLAGYGWLGLASFKLIFADLSSADLALRAGVFLGVGAIFLTTALVGNRARRSRPDSEP